ncbi:MAG: hypothetical protein IPL78_30880 [Chloroflexi bacterium]|nr:hypothetical protein [Chloroflexota bacterium]
MGHTGLAPSPSSANCSKPDAFRRSIILQTELEPANGRRGTAIQDTITEVQEAVWVQTLGDNLVMVGAAHGRRKSRS